MESSLDRYLRTHTTEQGDAQKWLEVQTNIHTNYPQMLSGPVQGRLLKILVEAIQAKKILEIGAFTGYSTGFMAQGMAADGHIDCIEINDELEDLMRQGWEKAGVANRISLHLGDAKELIPTMQGPYDLIFIDANKREYPSYYELCLPLLRQGGLMLVDDVLWDGKVYADTPAQDAQTQGVAAFNDMVAKDSRVEVVVLPLRDGISLIRKI